MPGLQLPEIDIIERVENVCDPEKTAGEWITHLDMLEDGDKIKVRRPKCQSPLCLLDPPHVHICLTLGWRRVARTQLVYHEAPSKCESECRTIAKACEEVLSHTHPPLGVYESYVTPERKIPRLAGDGRLGHGPGGGDVQGRHATRQAHQSPLPRPRRCLHFQAPKGPKGDLTFPPPAGR